MLLGEENEEYEAAWATEWRTFDAGRPMGGAWNASAPIQNGTGRWGPIASFPYRYMMSSLRTLQMRVSYLLASEVVVNPDIYAYVALELGRTAEDAPDAFCFLATSQFIYLRHTDPPGPGEVANFERWLHQRDELHGGPDDVLTFPDARMSQTPAPPAEPWWVSPPHDWIARTAPRGVIGFTLAREFVQSASRPLGTAVVKVTLFDVLPGTVRLVQAHRAAEATATDGLFELAPPLQTTGDQGLKTLTFVVSSVLAVRPPGSDLPFDFEVRAEDAAGAPQALVVSMVRVVKTGAATLVQKTIVEMVAAGTVDDYDAAAKASLASKFAELAGVDPSAVEVIVRAASVIITVKIISETAAAAATLSSTLASTLSDASAASSFTGLTITSAPTIAVVTEAVVGPLPPPRAAEPEVLSTKTIVIIAAAAGSVALMLGVLLVCFLRKRTKRIAMPQPST